MKEWRRQPQTRYVNKNIRMDRGMVMDFIQLSGNLRAYRGKKTRWYVLQISEVQELEASSTTQSKGKARYLKQWMA